MRKSILPRFRRKVRFVKKAPTKNGNLVPIHISKMTLKHVLWWHSNIQPIVDDDPSRADRYWNWILIAASSSLTGKLLARRPIGLTVGIETDGKFIPCALMQLIGKFPYFIDRYKKSVFVWYLAVAPTRALLSLEDVKLGAEQLPKRLGSISLDIVVTYSMNHKRRGRTSLHAAKEGGEELLSWYTSRGMLIFPDEEKLHLGFRRIFIPSDGRYCYFDEEGALKEIKEFDPYR
jgi:hypothetical protein